MCLIKSSDIKKTVLYRGSYNNMKYNNTASRGWFLWNKISRYIKYFWMYVLDLTNKSREPIKISQCS